jgi:hypothetical protein
MRPFIILCIVIWISVSIETGLAQSKSETTEWISTKGKEILRNVTGNSSLQWQMDEYGRLKITDYKSKREGKSDIIERYSYFNLYEIDSNGLHIGKSPENENTNRLLIHCKPNKKACVKSRHYSTKTAFKTSANSFIAFPLKEEFDNEKVERLLKKLSQAVQMFQ